MVKPQITKTTDRGVRLYLGIDDSLDKEHENEKGKLNRKT
jgi:hypothetical protein